MESRRSMLVAGRTVQKRCSDVAFASALIVQAACGYPQPARVAGDAPIGDGNPGDAPSDSPLMMPDAAPFAMPTLVTALASSSFDGDPTLPADMTEIYFKSSRTGGEGTEDIWRSTRASTTSAWSAPASVAELSTAASETSPHVSGDGLTIWFLRSGTPNKTFVSTRASRSAPWATPVEVPELPTASYVKVGSATPDLRVAYMESRVGSTTRAHIVRATRASASAAWGTPVELPELASLGFNQNPWGTANDLAIIFSSDRTGLASGDLWMATRATTADPFGAPVMLMEISSADYDADPWISSDLRHIFFTNNAGGNYEIYEAHR